LHLFRILVVEDFGPFRQFICSELQKKLELQVVEAADGLEALRKTEEVQPDLILLDLGLPNLNGMEVARRVRQLAPAAKILFLSLETSSDMIREALSVGALGYLNKSRAQTDLWPALGLVLAGKRFVSTDLGFSSLRLRRLKACSPPSTSC